MLTTITVPKIVVRTSHLDGEDIFFSFLFIFLPVLYLVIASILWMFSTFDHSIHTVKTVTKVKVVHDSGLTSAQDIFIKQCKTNHIVPTNSQIDSWAIPNVTVTPWSCTYATN